MGFMQPEIIRADFVELDGRCGLYYVPTDVLARATVHFLESEAGGWPVRADEMPESIRADLAQFYEGPEFEVAVFLPDVYGARLSAPGYLDCTEWTVHSSAAEAKEYLEEVYGEEDDS